MIISCISCSKVPEENADNMEQDVNTDADTANKEHEIITDEVDTSLLEDDVVKPRNPLTGEETDEDTSSCRPVAVMVNNISYAMPQLGVSHADIIYEMIVEGGITRLFAIFQNLEENEILGSIRSARHNYLDLVEAYDAILVRAGGSSIANEQVYTRNIDNIDGVGGDGNLFYRDAERLETMAYEHTLCITGESILNYLKDESGFRLEHEDNYKSNMVFTDDVKMPNSESALNVSVYFGLGKTSEYIYNSDSGKYGMRQYDDTYIDGNTGEAVEFKNIIVIQTDVQSIDSADHKEITLTGNGNGWFACNGKISEITWSRTDGGQFEYTYSDGSALEYGIGTTYVCVIANSGSVEAE